MTVFKDPKDKTLKDENKFDCWLQTIDVGSWLKNAWTVFHHLKKIANIL